LKRLSADGFLLAEQDLTLRGPGEVLGTRQSGMPGFLVLDPVVDVELLAATRAPALAAAEGLTDKQLEALRERAVPATRLKGENLLAGGGGFSTRSQLFGAPYHPRWW
jgi:RecG-like helicase